MLNATTSISTVLVVRPRFVIESIFFCGHGHAQAAAVMVFRQSGVKQLGRNLPVSALGRDRCKDGAPYSAWLLLRGTEDA